MTSSGPDRSLTGMSLPQWMKSKISDRYDLEQTPFSPPNTEDGFFLIRYKKAAPEQPEAPLPSTPQVTTSNCTSHPLKQNFDDTNRQIDLSQLTDSCKKFITNAPREIGMRQGVDTSFTRIKSTGTDDGFKNENTTACGYSVVAVAHQMIAERTADKLSAPLMNQRIRRNSKSLPASPQTSPKLLRKNPYFTNIIFGSTDGVDNENSNTSIMRGSVEELSKWTKITNNRTINEIDNNTVVGVVSETTIATSTPPTTAQLNINTSNNISSTITTSSTLLQQKSSSSTVGMTTSSSPIIQNNRQMFTPSPTNTAGTSIGGLAGHMVSLKAKPSHLREMNFWSPTSM